MVANLASGSAGRFDMIGREADVAAVREGLRASRLLTITGPGGIGKTTLARAVAGELPGPIVDLTHVRHGDQVVAEVAAAVLDPRAPRRELDAQVAEALAGDSRLVLDNLEGVDGAAVPIQALLDGSPELRILATSRVPIGVEGEAELPLGPLPTPAEVSWAALERAPAGALLLRRAVSTGVELDRTDAELHALVAICRRLDGMPLGLELAAGLLRVMTPSEIARELQLGLGELRDARRPARHRSMADVLTWSLDHLTANELALLQAASVTSGSFDLALLRSMGAEDAISGLDTLLSRGLVRAIAAPSSRRFAILETVREAALSRASADERGALRAGHAHAILRLVEDHGSQLDGLDTFDYEVLTPERENLRSALAWGVQHDAGLAAAMVARLASYWFQTNQRQEGIDWADRVLALRLPDEASWLHVAATRIVSVWSTDSATANLLADELRPRALQATDPRAATRALAIAAMASSWTFEPEALGYLEQARAVALDRGFPKWIARLDVQIARALDGVEGPEALAARLYAAIDMAAKAGDRMTQITANGNLLVVLGETDPVAAAAAGERSLALIGQQNAYERAWQLGNLADLAAKQGDVGRARSRLAEAVAEVLAQPGLYMFHVAINEAFFPLFVLGHEELAARTLGLARVLDKRVGHVAPPRILELEARDLRRVRAVLGEVKLATLLQRGRSEDPEALYREIAVALETHQAPSVVRRLRHGDLTAREVEVLALLGNGQTDAEIGAALGITLSTASVHVSNIKGKLGVRSRLEAALKAKELGL